jgi:hypothetical protein
VAEDGTEVYRLVDPVADIGDRIFGAKIGDWAILSGATLVAKLTRLKRSGEPANGLLGKLEHWLKSSDHAIVSAGEEHALPAPVALCMCLIFRELYDPSGG